jgi:hypothetical protein
VTYKCQWCGVENLKTLWGPGRTVCPACGRRAPTAAEWRNLENERRLDEALKQHLDETTCGVCQRPVRPLPLTEHAACVARKAAFIRAREAWGGGAVVGYGCLLQNGTSAVFYAGRTEKGLFTDLGIGNSWEEAFANARRVLFHLSREKIVLSEEVSP